MRQAEVLLHHRVELERRILEVHQAQVRQTKAVLLEAMGQLSQALQRQDELLRDRTGHLATRLLAQQDELKEQKEMLAEVLNSLQPSAIQQLGVPRPQQSLPRSVR
jgi:hypothetical protein